MSTFFEKLKKGMEVEEIPKEEPVKEEPMKKEVPKKKRVKKERTMKKEKKIEFKKIEVKEEPSSFRACAKEEGKEKKWFQPEGQLTVDVYQTDKEFVVQAAIAGVKSEDLDISIEKDMLIIKGVREKPAENEERNYFYQECYWGPFSREVVLPEEVDCSRIQALMKEGILTIRVPKIERRTNKKITIGV